MAQATRYASVLAKIGAERGTFLGEDKLKALTESTSLADLAAQLRETVYNRLISRLSKPLSSRKLERSFQESLIDDYLKIIKYSPKTAQSYLQTYFQGLEVENVKALIKAVYTKMSTEEKLEHVYFRVEDYFKRRIVFEEAAKAVDLKGVAAAFRKTEYAADLRLGLRRYEENGSVMFFDVSLDRAFLEKLYSAYQALPRQDKPHASYYAGMDNDSFVLLSLLRGKILGYDTNWLRLAIPRYTYNLPKETIEALLTAVDYESALSIALKSAYGKLFNKSETPEETIGNAQKAFQKAKLSYAKEARMKENFNIGATLAFLVQKEAEVRNLSAISVGVEAQLPAEDIQRALLLPD
ncbi:MAG: V-type ATPase subunit [Candidatus Bathyarchaeota archaeon]|nr:V-type ATPase subunit [Candidatus Bathyarchaeota archaeon]